MNRLKTILHCLALAALIAAIAESALLVHDARQTLNHVNDAADTLKERTKAVGTEARRVITVVGGIATQGEKASKEQRQSLEQTQKQLRELIAQASMAVSSGRTTIETLNAAIAHTDTSINDHVLVSADESLKASRVGIEALTAQAEQTSAELTPILKNAADATAAATSLLSHSSIPVTLENIQSATAHIDQSTANVEETTKELNDYARRLTKPTSLAWTALKTSMSWLGSVGTFVKGVFH